MSKLKTNKSLKKRVTISARGKVKYKKTNNSHLMSGTRLQQKRRQGGKAVLAEATAKSFRKAMPYDC